MLTEIRRHGTFRLLPRYLVKTTAIVLALAGLYAFAAVSGQEPPTSRLATILAWSGPAFYLAFGRARRRSTDLDVALPITARRLWLVHVVANLLGTALIAAASIACLALAAQVTGRLPGWFPLELDLPSLAVGLAAALALAVAVIESDRPRLAEPPVDGKLVARTATALLGALALTIGLETLPLGWSLVPLALAAGIGAATWRNLPESFTLAPREARSAEAMALETTEKTTPRSVPSAWTVSTDAVPWLPWAVFRALGKGSLLRFMSFPFLAAIGVILAGWYSGVLGGSEIRFTYIGLTVYCLLAFLADPVKRLPLLEALPISRRLIFAVLVLPGLGAVAAGYGTGRYLVARHGGPADEGPFFPLVFLAVAGLWLLVASLYLATYRPGFSDRGRKGVFAGLLVLLILFHVAQYGADMAGVLEIATVTEAVKSTIHRLAPNPTATAGVWAVCAALAAAAYRLAERQFLRVEVLPGDTVSP